jgi:uncharacterized membrane protein YagU involved in acid resistance
MLNEPASTRAVARNVVAGLAGGLVASYVMERFQASLSRLSNGHNAQSEDEPATYKAADAASRAAVGRAVPRENKPAAGEVVHYAFGGAVGAIYGAAAARSNAVTAWAGLPFGATLWLVADEIGVPMAGFSKAPSEYALSTHLSALAAHLVYGATTETVRRLLTRVSDSRRPSAFPPE